MTPIIGILASATTAGQLGSFESIATVTVGSGGASEINFTSIPSTYQHLQVRGISRTTEPTFTRGDFRVRVNGDTGSNYAWHLLIGDGSSASAFASTSQTFGRIGYGTLGGATASRFGGFVIDILDYASTSKNKTFRTLSGADLNGEGAVSMNSDLWMSTAAITSLRFYPSNNDWAQDTTFALYGIK